MRVPQHELDELAFDGDALVLDVRRRERMVAERLGRRANDQQASGATR
jgi:hypothetical protein